MGKILLEKKPVVPSFIHTCTAWRPQSAIRLVEGSLLVLAATPAGQQNCKITCGWLRAPAFHATLLSTSNDDVWIWQAHVQIREETFNSPVRQTVLFLGIAANMCAHGSWHGPGISNFCPHREALAALNNAAPRALARHAPRHDAQPPSVPHLEVRVKHESVRRPVAMRLRMH